MNFQINMNNPIIMNKPMKMNNQMNMNSPMNVNGPMNKNMNNMDMMSLLLQMNNMNQMMYNQVMQNFQNMKEQNIQKPTNSGSNDEFRNASDTGFDPFLGNTSRRLNVFFELSTGKAFNVLAPINITVFQLIDGFFQKAGILNPELQRKINFLYNGRSLLRYKDGQKNNTIITNSGFDPNSVMSKILVVDLQNILGA